MSYPNYKITRCPDRCQKSKNYTSPLDYLNYSIHTGPDEGISYTEDKIPIRKLSFGTRIKTPMKNRSEIKNFFRKFGKIEEFEIEKRLKKYTTFKVPDYIDGFVTYKLAESVSSILMYHNYMKTITENSLLRLKYGKTIYGERYAKFELDGMGDSNINHVITFQQQHLLYGIFGAKIDFDVNFARLVIKFDKIHLAEKTYKYFYNPLILQCANSYQQPQKIYFEEQLSLLKLNDDCLKNICKYLPLKDNIHLIQLSDRFTNLIPTIKSLTPEILNLNHDNTDTRLTLIEIEDIIIKCGNKIEYVFIDNYDLPYHWTYIMQLITENCTELKVLQLKHIDFDMLSRYDYNFSEEIYDTLTNLEELIIRCCTIKDDTLKFLPYHLNIRKLDVCCNYDLIGNSLIECRQIISLTLNIGEMRTYVYREIFDNLIYLTELTLLKDKSVDINLHQIFDLIIEKCKYLRILKIDYDLCDCNIVRFSKFIIEIKTLNKLDINIRKITKTENMVNFMNTISKSILSKELEILSINLGTNIKPFIQSIKEFENLKILYISNEDIITIDDIAKIIQDSKCLIEIMIYFEKHIELKFILRFIDILKGLQKPLIFKIDALIKDSDYENLLQEQIYQSSHNDTKFFWIFNKHSQDDGIIRLEFENKLNSEF